MPPTQYPTPDILGPQYTKFTRLPKDYKDITVINVFEDQGASYVETADDMPERWEFVYDGLTETEAAILDAHYASARLSQGFDFTEPRDNPWTGPPSTTLGTAYADQSVYYESYTGDHTKVWIQSRRVVLVRRPV